MTLFTYAALLAQEAPAAEHTYGITDIEINLMFWTLIVFGITFFIVWKFFMPKIFAAVEAREKAIDDAKRDRDAAAKLLAEHQAAIEAAKGDAQKLIADARAVGEKMRAELLETTRKEQGEMLDRARRDIETEKDKAIVMLRREAVEMAILGAGRVIEENLDSDKNRKLVDGYLASIATNKVKS